MFTYIYIYMYIYIYIYVFCFVLDRTGRPLDPSVGHWK